MTPHEPGIVEAINIRIGQKVLKGQELVVFKSIDKQVVSVDDKSNLSAENLRDLEKRKREAYEARVLEHVQAQLAVRDLDARGGDQVVGKETYDLAIKREVSARQEMDTARDDHETASLARARSEYPSRGALSAAKIENEENSAPLWLDIIKVRGQSNVLQAPVSGSITAIHVRQGQALLSDETVLIVMPEVADKVPVKVMAQFHPNAGNRIKVGDPAVMSSNTAKLELKGRILHIETGPAGTEQPITALLEFSAIPSGILQPGQEVSCEVSAHQIFGHTAFSW